MIYYSRVFVFIEKENFVLTDYREKINAKFDQLLLTPRERQVDIINAILNSFIDKKFKFVTLSASTGIGKSLIALIVSEILYESINENKKHGKQLSFVVCHTNTLIDQYENSYSNKFNLLRVNGAVNYRCEALSTASAESTAEDCIAGKPDTPSSIKQKCEGCEFQRMRRLINKSQHIVTNYAYFYTSMLYSDHLRPRVLSIFDESHLKAEVFSDFLKIEILSERLEKYSNECRTEGLRDIADTFDYLRDNIIEKRISVNNYIEFIEDLRDNYSEAEQGFIDIAEHERIDNNIIGYKIFNKKAKKFGNLKQKINDFLLYRYEHVVDIKDDMVIISPIFMNGLFDEVNNSDYNLFMSATVDEEYMSTTLGIDKNTIDFIYGGSIFDPDNKKIVDCGLEGINYQNVQDKKFMNDICGVVNDIVHEYDDTKGIILVTSFAQLRQIQERLQTYILANDMDVKIFAQTQGQGLYEILEEFKQYKKPSVLISPSIFEGIDLEGELSRYVIFFKAPYYSLGDKRIKYISNKYPAIYERLALYRVIQGSGRCVRSESDYCDTYFIDGALNRLFNSKYNIWKKEFKKYIRKKS